MNKYYLALFIAAALTVIAQLLLKRGASVKHKNRFVELFLNQYVILGYILFVTVTVLSMYALKQVPLIMMVVINPLIQILVVVLSMFLFKERLNKMQLRGFILIVLGIIVFNI
jgi:drug/metabolite transporter (DMT)-like permease